jgi:hypothetical protein
VRGELVAPSLEILVREAQRLQYELPGFVRHAHQTGLQFLFVLQVGLKAVGRRVDDIQWKGGAVLPAIAKFPEDPADFQTDHAIKLLVRGVCRYVIF